MTKVLKYPNANFCELCFPNCTYYGEIVPGFDFVQWKYDTDIELHYSIVNDHDEIFRFAQTPVGNPIPDGLSDEQISALYKDEAFCQVEDIYTSAVYRMEKDFLFDPKTGHELFLAAEKQGWSQEKHGLLQYWMMDRAAQMIKVYDLVGEPNK